MATIDAEKLKESIQKILKGADLASLSAKKVRRQLEEEYDADLTHRKKEIDEMLMKLVDAAENGEDNEEEEAADDDSDSELEDEAPKKKKAKGKKSDEEVARKLQDEENGRRTRSPKKEVTKKPRGPRSGTSIYSRPCQLSEALAAVVGTDQMARKDVVKTMWNIVKERDLQDPKNRQYMICDDQLLKVFGKKRLRTFGMMKYLKDHIKQMN